MGQWSCVDTVPIVPEESEFNKIFVECELKANSDAQAFVSLVDYVNSGSSKPSKPNESDVFLLLGEFKKEDKFPFLYNLPTESYMLYNQTMKVAPGKFYTLKGQYKDYLNPLQGMVEMPYPFAIDSIVVFESNVQQTGANKWKMSGRIRLYPDRDQKNSEHFLHIDLMDSLHNTCAFYTNADVNKFFRLTHRPGILLKMQTMENTEYLELNYSCERNFLMTDMIISIKNTSPSYYEYQKFKSNSPYNPSHSYNPAIAAFNMSSETGYGSLTATNEVVFNIELK